MNIDTAKSYATRENLEKALDHHGLLEAKPVIVRNTEGRWTAIFGYGLSGLQQPVQVARLGFIIIN